MAMYRTSGKIYPPFLVQDNLEVTLDTTKSLLKIPE